MNSREKIGMQKKELDLLGRGDILKKIYKKKEFQKTKNMPRHASPNKQPNDAKHISFPPSRFRGPRIVEEHPSPKSHPNDKITCAVWISPARMKSMTFLPTTGPHYLMKK